ncbi:hypothetical protein LTR53_011076 [Teratosphaeriaceae sp. CCFEE 6253]|nr:hypothetical protein LTR53_011076 [Teratosphaeriaceae sp. CCFEE 6253]
MESHETAHHAPVQPWVDSQLPLSGQRRTSKRQSFFGRALSDAAPRRMPTLHSTMSSQSTPPQQPQPQRPSTALSATRRRKTEPLQQIRDSIFGGRKKASPPNSRDGASSTPELRPASRGGALLPRDQFTSEDDCETKPSRIMGQYTDINADYRYLRKNSISPPFNFEHVTHTAKQQLPPLDTVAERDLPGRFWSVSAYQRPKRHLNGIRADDLSEKLPAMGVERGSPSSRPTSPVPGERGVPASRPTSPLMCELDSDRPWLAASSGPGSGIDGMMFDEAKETIFDPTLAIRQIDKPQIQTRFPQRKSSLVSLNERRLQYLDGLASSPEQDPTAGSLQQDNDSAGNDQHPGARGRKASRSLEDVTEECDRASSCRTSSTIDRSRQPLPPVPQQSESGRRSRSSLRQTSAATISMMSTTPNEVTSRPSRRSSASTFQSPTAPTTARSSNPTLTSLLSAATWEDDVEFCYQQEAESTCHYDWRQNARPTPEPSIAESDGGPTGAQPAVARHQHRGLGLATTTTASPPFTPKTLHFRGFDGAPRVRADSLSDPESGSTRSSRDRASSSCSSYDSAVRYALTAGREPGRSSIGSLPEPPVMHGKRQSRSALRQSAISRPLESLPQSPGVEGQDVAAPAEARGQGVRDSVVARLPQRPGDRAAMSMAGRAAQHPARISRLVAAAGAGRPAAAVKASVWIWYGRSASGASLLLLL